MDPTTRPSDPVGSRSILRRAPAAAVTICALLLASALQPGAGAADAAAKTRVFKAGAATSNITPPLGISLAGVISQNEPARHVHDELHARCLVLDDGMTRVAIVVCDSTMISREIFDAAKRRVTDATGLPAQHILISATHSHSTPRPLGITKPAHPERSWETIDPKSGALEAEYEAFLARRLADGIRRAINNLAPARIGWGRSDKPEWLFNRRWFLAPGATVANPFGGTEDRVQMNPRAGSPAITKPAGGVDPELVILSVQHSDGRPLAALANYGLHYIGGTGAATVSADYFGAFASRLAYLLQPDRQDPPFVAMMANGTSGDVNGNNLSRPEPAAPPYARINKVADDLARAAQRIIKSIDHKTWVPLAMTETEIELGVRRPDRERLQWARQTWAKRNPSAAPNQKEVYAREALALADFPGTVRVKLQAIALGDLGIAAAPCEVFAATGLQIKERSPFPTTFTISLANGYNGYLPTPRDHELGGYETWPARSSYLEVEASEKIRDELLRQLNSMRRIDSGNG